MRIRKSVLAVLIPLVVLLAVLAVLVPQSRFALLIAIGRNYCPIGSVWSVGRLQAKTAELRKQLEQEARVVREEGDYLLWEAGGQRVWMPLGSRVLPGMLAEQKTAIYESAGQAVRPGDVVLDCGANVGLGTLAALERGASLVVAIEPALDNVECLHRNLASYVDAGRVVICPKGVWNKDDVLPLNVQPSNTASYSVALKYRGAAPGPYVQLTTIDELVRELKLERVDYIKMDIEGAEREALAGAAGTIRRFHPRLTVSMEHRYDDPKAIPIMVLSLWSGYRIACGRCIEQSAGLRPAVLSFYAGR
jgi:FkbM family methyltransferase